MTKKLYYDSAYATSWKTEIEKTMEKDGKYFVFLKETAFYPHGGGQPCDTGNINGIPVLDVFTEGIDVVHEMQRLPEKSDAVCQINWNRRFDHMQHHSGQHLLSAVCRNLFNANTVSFHLGKDYVSIDVDNQKLTSQQLHEIEREVNKQIFENRKIHSYFVTSEELMNIPVVKKPKVTENIRIVETEGIEYNACGGTHVSQTGEIGLIKLLKTENQKGNLRIFFKCGYRALEDYNDILNVIAAISAKFNSGHHDILNRIKKLEDEKKEVEAEVKLLKEKNDTYYANELLLKTKGDFLTHLFEDKSLKDMQQLAAKLASENDLLVLFANTSENKIVFVHNGTKEVLCGEFFKEHLTTFGGKGGGNNKSAQAGFSTPEDTLRFFHFTSQQVKAL